ncbi:MAG: BspA family leucine-rich repeat surface protein [Eubacterium sp.]|nr:BspA family leucine-rich repeat surface protein [Eubacterium sp.]
MKKTYKQKGFTLVELIVVLVVLAIVAAMVIPALLSYIDGAKDKEAKARAQKALTATQTALSDIYNDGGNRYDPDKRSKTRELAGSDTSDGTAFTVWTESVLWDGVTPATPDNIGSYTVKKALYKDDENTFLYFDGKKWTKYDKAEKVKAMIEDAERKNVIYVWPFSQDFAYLDGGNASAVYREDGPMIKVVRLNLNTDCLDHIYFVRDGRDYDSGRKYVDAVFWKEPDDSINSYWYVENDDDLIKVDDYYTYKLHRDKGYNITGWVDDSKENGSPKSRNVIEDYIFNEDNKDTSNFSFTLAFEFTGKIGEVTVSNRKLHDAVIGLQSSGGIVRNVTKVSDTAYADADALLAEKPSAVRVEDENLSSPGFSMYVWLENDGNLCWWTDASDVYLPADCSGMLAGLENLVRFDFGGMDSSRVTSVEGLFTGSENLTSVSFGASFEAPLLTTAKDMFSGCLKLTDPGMSDFRASGGTITDISGMFENCTSLEGISFDSENFVTTAVTDMSRVFSGCENLASADVSGFDTANVRTMESIFSGCKSLAGIPVSGWDFKNCETLNSAFKNCESLVIDTADIKGVSSKLTDMSEIFSGCKALTTATLSGMEWNAGSSTGWDLSGVTTIAGSFSGCSSVEAVNIRGWNLDYTKLTDMSSAFSGMTALERVNIPDKWTLTACEDISYLFSGCTKLDQNFDGMTTTNALKYIGHVFEGCSSLTELDLEDWVTSGLDTSDREKAIGLAFGSCPVLKRIFATGSFAVDSSLYTVPVFTGDDVLCGGNGTLYSEADDVSAFKAWLDGRGDEIEGFANRDGSTSGYFTDRSLIKKYAMFYDMKANNEYRWTQEKLGVNIETIKHFARKTDIADEESLDAYISGHGYNKFEAGVSKAEIETLAAKEQADEKIIELAEQVDTYPVYLWFEADNDATLYWWSEADIVYINPASVGIFDKWTIVEDIDLQGTDFTLMEDFSNLFWGDEKLTRIYDGSTGDVNSAIDYRLVTTSAKSPNNRNQQGAALLDYGMRGMFLDCKSLQSVDLSGFKTDEIESMGQMFQNCTTLTSLDLSSFDTSKVEKMIEMFDGCTNLQTITFGNGFTCENVTTMKKMFNDCKAVKKLDLRYMTGDEVTDIWHMFNNAAALEEVDLRKFVGSKLSYMGEWFNSLKVLKKVNLSSLTSGEGLTDINKMFFSCNALTSLTIGKGFACDNVTNMANMFNGCKVLENIDIRMITGDSVTNIGNMFASCNALKNLNMHNFTGKLITSMNGWFNGREKLETVDLSSLDSTSLTDTQSMFLNCKKLSTLSLGENFKCQNVTNAWRMFQSCNSLVTLDLSNFDFSRVEKISSMFMYCSSLKNLTLGAGFTCENNTETYDTFNGCKALETLDISMMRSDSLITAQNMFQNCESLTTLTLGEGFTCDKVDVMQNMFNGCKAIENLDLHMMTGKAVTNISGMFTNCNKLRKLNMHNFEGGNLTSFQQWFSGKTVLEDIDLTSLDSRSATTTYQMFYNCRKLTKILLGENFTCSNVTTMQEMFHHCDSLKSIDLSHLNSSSLTNASKLLWNCGSLTSVTFGPEFTCENVTDMNCFFEGCSSLKEVDLSYFNTVSLKDTRWMFKKCSALEKIYVSDPDENDGRGFYYNTVTGLTRPINSHEQMFCRCKSLVGEMGTRTVQWNQNVDQETNQSSTNRTYARVDKSGQPGYFSVKKYTQMKKTANNWVNGNTFGGNISVSSITRFARNISLSTESEVLALRDRGINVVDMTDGDRPYKVYVWVDNNVVYWWSKADVVYINPSTRSMFYQWSNITEIDMQGLDTSLVKNFSSFFRGAGKLQRIINGSTGLDYVIKTDSATEGENGGDTSGGFNFMFQDCKSLTSVDLSGFKTDNVNGMNRMFERCSSLTALDVSTFDTSDVVVMGYMFNGCEALTDIDISNFSSESLKYAEFMFYGCNKLQRVNLGDDFTVEKADRLESMFQNCKSLTELDLSMFDTKALTKCNNMFNGCSNLTTIYVSDPDENSGKGFYYRTSSGLDSQITNGGSMFSNCSNLVGGNGTKQNVWRVTDATAACVDKDDQQGYFSVK